MKTLLILIFLVIVLCTTNVNAQTKELDKTKAEIAELLKKEISVWKREPGAYTYTFWAYAKGTLVFDDRIEFRSINRENIIVYFFDIIDNQITIDFDTTNNFDRVYFGNLDIVIPGKGKCRKFFDDLIIIQKQLKNQLNEKRNSQLILFETMAEQYRSLKVKPKISEEQRKYIIQANGFNDQKMYDKAIELYKKAIEVDQTAYPAAYSNLALLLAQTKLFNAAIFNMKKYLMLEPEAADARGAQDKIYLWEAQITK